MRRKLATIAVTLAVTALAATASAQSNPGHPVTRSADERVGIYDSRAIAVAFAGSYFQKTKLNDIINQRQKAEQVGDKKEVARLESEGRAWQGQLHRQGFGTAPVDDLLVHIVSDIPRIQQEAGVTRLISKWDRSELQRYPNAKRIDVTMKLVDAFHPTELQRKRALEIQTKPPVKSKE